MELTQVSHIVEIKDLWEKLYHNNKSLSWYQSYSWNSTLEKVVNGRRITKYYGYKIKYLIYENKVIIPVIQNDNKKILEMLGGRESSDYISFIYDDSISKDELTLICEQFFNNYSQYTIILDKFNRFNRLTNLLLSALSQKGNVTIEKKECVCVNCSQKGDIFYNTLGKSSRQNYRTAKNRLNKDGLTYRIEMGVNLLSREKIKTFQDIYSERRLDCDSQGKGKILRFVKRTVKMLLAERDIDGISDFSRNNVVFSSAIYINDEIAAFCEGCGNNDGKSISIARVATNKKYYKYSPGQILLIETIDKIKTKYDYFDLTRGVEDYKFKLGGVIHNNYCITITGDEYNHE